jgi:uncharacterized protein YdaT
MPWDETHYPVSMKNLPEDVRRKAIEIANALLEEGSDEGRAIATGTSRAEKWAQNRDRPQSGPKGKARKKRAG